MRTIGDATDNLPFLAADTLSVTNSPVHLLSNLEWKVTIEMIWAARGALSDAMNAERRAWFESVKALLLERDLPRSRIQGAAPMPITAAVTAPMPAPITAAATAPMTAQVTNFIRTNRQPRITQ